ncbi:MAG: FAD-dependent oxidoreductase [Coriobacteriia bacterium]|nr:FAD-dependent oxidoreductase [Coriobacteriia bacterium]
MSREGLSRRDFLKGAALTASAASLLTLAACNSDDKEESGPSSASPGGGQAWTQEADVVIIGGGIVGIVAAIRAKDLGASVIIIEANYAAGGHALTSGGIMHLGGGNSLQRAQNIEDSADKYYLDHTAPGQSRDEWNIREVIRGAADVHAEAFEFLLDNNWEYAPGNMTGGGADSVPRTVNTDDTKWQQYSPLGEGRAPRGVGLTRSLERSARDKGVEFIMNHHVDKIYRDASTGDVVGVMAPYTPRIMPGETEPLVDFEDFLDGNIDTEETVYVKANKGVVIATGGSSSNWEFHSLFDPRYGPEHSHGVGGDPFSFQDASGEIMAMEIGATLGATEVGINVAKARAIGCQYGYRHRTVGPGSPIWPEFRAYGFDVDTDRTAAQGIIYVNMLGERFASEDGSANAYWSAALGSAIVEDEDGKAQRLAGPVWAIFDEDWRKERDWNCDGYPDVDREEGYFFSADTLDELAEQIVNKFYEDIKMPPANLVATIERYNGFVDAGVDDDFNRTTLTEKIQTPPFYAAWCPNAYHDTLIGILINGKFQVLDFKRQVIPRLYCGGEASAGQGMHGHGKNVSNGYAIGTNIVKETAI